MDRKITFKGNSLTLVGRGIKAGNAAPYFRVVAQDLKEIGLSDFRSKVKLITSFPSIDTPVCDLQVKEFNRRAVGLSSDIVIMGISKDLPFAQARFCQANDIKNILTFSDYKFSSFGINYGLLIKELNLLARAIIIVDKNDVLRYIQIVEELTTAPDYNDALNNLELVFKNPQGEIQTELPAKCKACEAGVPALVKEKIEKLLAKYRGWELIEDKRIVKEFKFKDFTEAKYFLDLVSVIAQEQGHHPNLTLIYNKLKITLTTHSSGGLTENDFIMAKIIDELQG
ncbi:MAG: thiol peroxidase [Candidatus Omnitrophota bacterium]